MNELQTVNPYGNVVTPAAAVMRVGTDVEVQRAVAEVQAMVLMAKKFPRNPIEATERILNECQRPGLAEVALYTYSRGGTDISGPSIRLAETIARHWGNMESGVVELSNSNGQSEMLAYCWDMETNTRQKREFIVKHERSTKKGSYQLTDQRDIYELNANLAARRLRASILASIPGDVVEAAVAQCEQTLHAKADTSPAAIQKMIEAFKNYDVTKEQIEKRIQRRVDAITAAQVISLRKIYNSLKDGMSTATDWFEIIEPVEPVNGKANSGADAAKEAIAKKLKKETTKPEPEVVSDAAEPTKVPCPNLDEGELAEIEYCRNKCGSYEGCPSHS